MYCYNKEELPKQVQDAVMLCEFMGMKWYDLYMDPNGELAITFEGELTPEQAETVNMHFLDLLYAQKEKYSNPDYEYHKGNTIVYTPDGENFKRLFV